MKNEIIIETKNLEKLYGIGDSQVYALRDITLQIASGEFVAIMGPSGSGKSTLLNILACLDRPTGGQYLLGGEDVSDLTRAELADIRSRKLGFVFQSYNLLPRMTALENVMLPMMYARSNRVLLDHREEKAQAVLEMVGLGNRMHHLPAEMSGGQQQRVAIARSLINDPILILADEPTGNLDTRSSEEILALLRGLHEQGRTIVMVTHDPDIAKETTGRILHVRDGVVISDELNNAAAVSTQKVILEA